MRDTVRCPFCVLGFECFPMVAHVDGRYICGKCGHTAYPDDAAYLCRCSKCLELAAAQIAS
jgi:ribosomal protein S27AE